MVVMASARRSEGFEPAWQATQAPFTAGSMIRQRPHRRLDFVDDRNTESPANPQGRDRVQCRGVGVQDPPHPGDRFGAVARTGAVPG
jgi:hypothetical protein